MKHKSAKPKLSAFTGSLSLSASNYAFRCDAKYADDNVRNVLAKVERAGCVHLGEFLPQPFVKGVQPDYMDQPTDDSVPVINTLAIQNLSIDEANCRHVSHDDFDELGDERKLRKLDVLLTVDGGVSIGKPCLFNKTGKFTIDSHVVVLRPSGLTPLALVYLLASPLGQVQFRRAESGASGQTTVTEDDIRRFVFPEAILATIDVTAKHMESERLKIARARKKLQQKERGLWGELAKLAH